MSAASGTASVLSNGVSAAVAASPMDAAPKGISNNSNINNANMEAVTSSSTISGVEAAHLNGSHAGAAVDDTETPEIKLSAVPETTRSGATAASTGLEAKDVPKPTPSSSEIPAAVQPLPANLRRILAEVAKTGTCSWLSWQTSTDNATKDSHMKESNAAVGGGVTYAQSTGSSSTAAAELVSAASAAAATAAAASSSQGGVSGKTAPAVSATHSSLPGTANANNTNTNINATTNTTKYALGMAIPASRAQSRRPYNTHFNAVSKAGATRKKHRSSNGMKVSRRRLQQHEAGIAAGSKTTTQTTGGAVAAAAAAGGRKRPLFLIRTSAAGAQNVFSPGSVGSGRTSGSEPDDSTTQYECDSEGTSSCSEFSTERRDHQLRNMQRISLPGESNKPPTASTDEVNLFPDEYHCLRDVFRMSLGLVLDHWYKQKGGYKLSPAERRRSQTASADNKTTPANAASSSSTPVNGEKTQNPNNIANGSHSTSTENKGASPSAGGPQNVPDKASLAPQGPSSSSTDVTKKAFTTESAEDFFSQRRRRLLIMLGQTGDNANRANPPAIRPFQAADDDGPPFTIQRIAEVLLAPERYYTQTHKLCNCLEKLLLVTSSTSAFGGSTGGATSQSRLEEQELAALADERGRLESEFRQQALKRRHSALSDDMQVDGGGDASLHHPGSPSRDEGHDAHSKDNSPSPEKKSGNDSAGSESSSREMLEAAARSLRTKFDHVGIDPHSSAVANRDVRSIAENRGMTNSPPPPSLGMSNAAASSIALPGHTVGTFVRQHLPEQNAEHPSIARVPSPPILFSQGNESSPIGTPLHAAPNLHLHMHHAPLGGVPMGSAPFDVVAIQAGGGGVSAQNAGNSNEGGDLEGRSSASNSDIDSESDDVSFDDSASDRSDGSDSGHYEPFTAARAMALNRIQQQQRLQSRVLTSLALHQSEGGSSGFRPPADSEYQSGDSIDSTRGEDSGGSDSSSSDVAD